MEPTEEQTYRQGVMQRFDSIDSSIGALDKKVTYTNGKVRWTEKMIYLAIGGLGVLSIIVIPLLLALLTAGKL